jgi:hypothetical protein
MSSTRFPSAKSSDGTRTPSRAFADLHASLGNLEEARGYLHRALENQSSPAQQGLLRQKRAALER